jgi:hypothetical protein
MPDDASLDGAVAVTGAAGRIGGEVVAARAARQVIAEDIDPAVEHLADDGLPPCARTPRRAAPAGGRLP